MIRLFRKLTVELYRIFYKVLLVVRMLKGEGGSDFEVSGWVEVFCSFSVRYDYLTIVLRTFYRVVGIYF